MNQLDDFEKYLRDQLKGHTDPDPLMWKRLTDALERVQPWYASSAIKYALTAVGTMVIGAISSYLYFDQNHTTIESTRQTKTHNQTESQAQHQAVGTEEGHVNANIKGVFEGFPNVIVASLLNDSIEDLLENPIESQVIGNEEGPVGSIEKRVFENLVEVNDDVISNVTGGYADVKLPLLATRNINIAKHALRQTPPTKPSSGRFELSLASGKTWDNLPVFNYQLGSQGLQQASIRLQQSPQFLVQARVYKNWHFQTGLQYLQSELTEHFYQTDVFSYDEKEHYLFPYIYGFRQMSDEELNEGPWPFGPNQPGGPEISHVKADFTSVVRKQQFILPLTIGYRYQFGAFAAQINTGMALCFDSKTSQSLRIPGYFPSTVYFKAANGQLQTFVQGQLRLSYKANQHLSIYLEPQLRTSLQQQYLVHAAPYRTNTKALFAGLSWNF